MERIDIDPLQSFPDLQHREFNYKYYAGELAWYMRGERNTEFIRNFSQFWEKLKDSDGNINSNYGDLLFYSNQLIWAHSSLLKDPQSRQAISFVSRPSFQYHGNLDFVCTVYLNFWIRENKLYMKVQMRSNDLFYGFTYDVPFFAAVHQTMWLNLRLKYPDLEIGTYHHVADNLHYYQRHFELGDRILAEKSEMRKPLTTVLKEPLFWILEERLEPTEPSLEFRRTIENLVVTGEITTDLCKQALQKLYTIY